MKYLYILFVSISLLACKKESISTNNVNTSNGLYSDKNVVITSCSLTTVNAKFRIEIKGQYLSTDTYPAIMYIYNGTWFYTFGTHKVNDTFDIYIYTSDNSNLSALTVYFLPDKNNLSNCYHLKIN